jgi:hypothetical protein
MMVIIKKLLFFNVIFMILYTFIFAQYVFENSLVDAQNIGYSVLISIPLSIFSIIFFTYLFSLILWFVINIILVPIIKIQNLSNNVVKTDGKLIFLLQTICKIPEISKKIMEIYMKKNFRGNETHRFMLMNYENYFYSYVNFVIENNELCEIVKNLEVSKILLNVDKSLINNIVKDEEYYISLYEYFRESNMIRKEVNSLKSLRMIKYDIEKECWLEKFEDFFMKKNIYLLGHCNYVKKIKNKRLNDKKNKYRLYIRFPEITKKLLYLKDKELQEYKKQFENDDYYYQ